MNQTIAWVVKLHRSLLHHHSERSGTLKSKTIPLVATFRNVKIELKRSNTITFVRMLLDLKIHIKCYSTIFRIRSPFVATKEFD
jgi:hypothetical protein